MQRTQKEMEPDIASLFLPVISASLPTMKPYYSLNANSILFSVSAIKFS